MSNASRKTKRAAASAAPHTRYVPAVPAVTVDMAAGPMKVTRFLFVKDTLLRDARWGKGRSTLRLADECEHAFKTTPETEAVPLREEVWRLLAAAAEEPQFPSGGTYDPHPSRPCLPIIDAICDATKEPPA